MDLAFLNYTGNNFQVAGYGAFEYNKKCRYMNKFSYK
jgi:hypothetical protein